MCQAIVKPSNVTLSKRILKAAWRDNPHSGGFAYRKPDSNSIHIDKGYFTFKTFWKAFQPYQGLDCLIHFRFATHGARTVENCHPFPLGGKAAIIHNGILSKFIPPATSPKSDTRHFVEDFLAPSLQQVENIRHALESPAHKTLVEALIGSSKLATLTPDGFVIHNEDLGEWHNGVWYSAGVPDTRNRYADLYDRFFDPTRGRRFIRTTGTDRWSDAEGDWYPEEEEEDETEIAWPCELCGAEADDDITLMNDVALCRTCYHLQTY